MSTREITTENFEAITRTGIVLIDWWASWCGPCRTFAPVFEASATANPDLVFGKVDVEANPDLAEAFDIRAIPTLMIYRDGVPLFANPGVLSTRQLQQVIEKVKALDMSKLHHSATPDPDSREASHADR